MTATTKKYDCISNYLLPSSNFSDQPRIDYVPIDDEKQVKLPKISMRAWYNRTSDRIVKALVFE